MVAGGWVLNDPPGSTWPTRRAFRAGIPSGNMCGTACLALKPDRSAATVWLRTAETLWYEQGENSLLNLDTLGGPPSSENEAETDIRRL